MWKWAAESEGLGRFVAWVLVPFLILPYLALVVAGVPLMVLLPESLDDLKRWIVLGSSVAVYALLMWRLYWVPRGDYLILHQLGFRIRIGLRTADVLFDVLHDIVIGRTPIQLSTRGLDPGVFLVAPPHYGVIVIEPPVPDEIVVTTGAAVEFHFVNGTQYLFPSVLTRFEADDLQRFFEFVHRHHPRLLPPIVPK